jgi:hypothetical protein
MDELQGLTNSVRGGIMFAKCDGCHKTFEVNSSEEHEFFMSSGLCPECRDNVFEEAYETEETYEEV